MKAMEVIAGLVESNSSLPPSIDGLKSPACTPGSAPGLTLGNEYGITLPFFADRYTTKAYTALVTLITVTNHQCGENAPV